MDIAMLYHHNFRRENVVYNITADRAKNKIAEAILIPPVNFVGGAMIKQLTGVINVVVRHRESEKSGEKLRYPSRIP